MHYKDGTPAQIGDVVKGTGYNVRDKDNNLTPIVGTVVGLTPGQQVCNIQVAFVQTRYFMDYPPHELFTQKCVVGCGPEGGQDRARVGAYVDLEYGQCDHFELVLRPPAPKKAET